MSEHSVNIYFSIEVQDITGNGNVLFVALCKKILHKDLTRSGPGSLMRGLSLHIGQLGTVCGVEPVLGAAAATGSKLVGKFLNLFLRREHSLYSLYYAILCYTQR